MGFRRKHWYFSDRFWVCAWVPPPLYGSSLSWVWSTHWHLSRSRWQGPAPPRYSPVSPAGRPARGLHNQHRKGLYSIRPKVNPFPPNNFHNNEITQFLMMEYWRFLLKVVHRERKSIPVPYEYNSLYQLFCEEIINVIFCFILQLRCSHIEQKRRRHWPLYKLRRELSSPPPCNRWRGECNMQSKNFVKKWFD